MGFASGSDIYLYVVWLPICFFFGCVDLKLEMYEIGVLGCRIEFKVVGVQVGVVMCVCVCVLRGRGGCSMYLVGRQQCLVKVHFSIF